VKYSAIDILTEPKLRWWLKYFSKWKTYPMIFIKGKVVGGLDVTKELIAQGKFLDMVPKKFKNVTVEEKLKELLNVPLIAFINGKSKTTEDEASKTFIKLLNDNGIIHHAYDMKTDPVLA
jgi:hypothetical protein